MPEALVVDSRQYSLRAIEHGSVDNSDCPHFLAFAVHGEMHYASN
jgi:hypothetical protein